MIRLTNALKAWGTPDFEDILKREITHMTVEQLPLQQGMTMGSHAIDSELDVMFLSIHEEGDCIYAKVGIFYSGIIAGCNCADDPTPLNEQHEYCEVLLGIDKINAETTVTLLA